MVMLEFVEKLYETKLVFLVNFVLFHTKREELLTWDFQLRLMTKQILSMKEKQLFM